jgi:hypothetical protein
VSDPARNQHARLTFGAQRLLQSLIRVPGPALHRHRPFAERPGNPIRSNSARRRLLARKQSDPLYCRQYRRNTTAVLGQRQHKCPDTLRKLMGLIDGNQVPATPGISFRVFGREAATSLIQIPRPQLLHPASRDRQVAHRERGAGTKRRIKTHARREHRTSVSNISSRKRRKKKLMRLRSLVSMS